MNLRPRLLALAALLLLALLLAWRLRPTPAIPDSPLAPAPASAASAQSKIENPKSKIPRLASLTPSALFRTVAENSHPGRLLFLDFHLSATTGLTLLQAAGAAGRAKSLAVSAAPAGPTLRYEARARDGTVTARGALPHPLATRLEYEDPAAPGALRSVIHRRTEAAFTLRLPGESAPARLLFFADDSSVLADIPLVP